MDLNFETTGNLKCGDCRSSGIYVGLAELKKHYRLDHGPLERYACGQKNCNKALLNLTSLVRHITSYHRGIFEDGGSDSGGDELVANVDNQDLVLRGGRNDAIEVNNQIDVMEDDLLNDAIPVIDDEENGGLEVESTSDCLERAAVHTLMTLRSTASLTGKAVERFQEGCYNMIQELCTNLKQGLTLKLREKGVSQDEIQEVLSELDSVENPFKDLKTIDDQLKYFHEKYGLVIPSQKLLDTRIDRRLDPATNCQVQCQVNETFQYVSLIESLEAVLSNKKTRDSLFAQQISNDGVLRSYADGSNARENEFLQRYENVIQILLFFDELEIANSLGSKTIIHKLATFFFQILNLPPEESSKLSSIFLLALAHSDDMKKAGAFEKVLTLFIMEMKRLTSDEGVEIMLDGEPFVLRALLGGVAADTPAAHDLMGLLGVGAKHFCRRCLISRAEARGDPNKIGTLRTIEQHQIHLEEVGRRPKFSTECGVKRSCPLSEVPYFDCTSMFIFDAFHDLLENVVPLVMKLVIRHYIFVKRLISTCDLNLRIASFCYGIPDSKNKPSANFTADMLCKPRNKLKQTGSQMWCLMRALPFILGNLIPEEDEHMHLIFLLQNIMRLVFSFEVQVADADQLDLLITQHHELFQRLFIDVPQEMLVEEEVEDPEVDDPDNPDGNFEEEVDLVQQNQREEPGAEGGQDPEDGVDVEGQGPRRKKIKLSKVHISNTLHHLKHYKEYLLKYGPLIRLWCAKFEGRMKIFRQHAAICCNFKNPPKTMAKMFQLSSLQSLVGDGPEKSLSFQRSRSIEVMHSEHRELLISAGLPGTQQVHYTNSAMYLGEDYRPGLFVCLPSDNSLDYDFAIITHVLVSIQTVYLVVKPWKNDGLSSRYNAHSVSPNINPVPLLFKVTSLRHHNCIAPWTTLDSDTVYLSLRTVPL